MAVSGARSKVTEQQSMPSGEGWRSRVVNRSLARATQRSLERGRLYVEATLDLLDESGTTSFTVQEVCDRARQSVRTFYQHFNGKDDLLLAVYEELFSALVTNVREEIADIESPLGRLEAAIASLISATVGTDGGRRRRDQALAHFRLELSEGHAADIAVVQRPYVALLSSLITEAIAAGEVPPCNPDHMAFMISALKTAYLHTVLLGNDVGAEAPSVEELVEFCIGGLTASER